MKSLAQKKEELSKLKDKMAKAKLVVFSSFARAGEKGLTVLEIRNLKKNLKAAEAEYMISKKTIFDKAIKEKDKSIDVFQYDGSFGAVFGYGQNQPVAKIIYNFAKKHPALKYFGAIMDGRFINTAGLIEFAKLPEKEVLIARLLWMMKYPLSALANVLDQISKKEERLT